MTVLTVEELARIGREMRNAQRSYFRARTQDALEEARRREREFDEAVDGVLREPTLFDREG